MPQLPFVKLKREVTNIAGDYLYNTDYFPFPHLVLYFGAIWALGKNCQTKTANIQFSINAYSVSGI